ncbi:hypothetical protein J6590_028528 [Homalodisca vitripennis]|nr:hypothetical protein J6590_028528 [Homalodisca vitripennis]
MIIARVDSPIHCSVENAMTNRNAQPVTLLIEPAQYSYIKHTLLILNDFANMPSLRKLTLP